MVSGCTSNASARPVWVLSTACAFAERAAVRSRVCEVLHGCIECRAAVEERLQFTTMPADTPRGQGSTPLGWVEAGEAPWGSGDHV